MAVFVDACVVGPPIAVMLAHEDEFAQRKTAPAPFEVSDICVAEPLVPVFAVADKIDDAADKVDRQAPCPLDKLKKEFF